MRPVNALTSTLRRVLAVPSVLTVGVVGAGSAWLAVELARGGLGATESFLGEVRHGSGLFAGLLVLSLAEPLELGRDARQGLLTLRVARGGSPGVGARWLGLVLATLPAVVAAALAAGGVGEPWALLLGLGVLAAGGLMLGAFLDRGLLVPALWGLALAGHLRPWLATTAWGRPVSWLLPDLGSLSAGIGFEVLGPALLWIVGALCVAHARVLSVAARGRWPSASLA